MQQRLVELETRIAYQEQTIEVLNDITVEQQKRIEALEAGIKVLVERVRQITPPQGARDEDETPPHY